MGSSVVHTLTKLRSDEIIDTRRFNHNKSSYTHDPHRRAHINRMLLDPVPKLAYLACLGLTSTYIPTKR